MDVYVFQLNLTDQVHTSRRIHFLESNDKYGVTRVLVQCRVGD
jgi:hypothetical protein